MCNERDDAGHGRAQFSTTVMGDTAASAWDADISAVARVPAMSRRSALPILNVRAKGLLIPG